MNPKEFFIDVPWGRLAVVTYHSEDLPLVIFCHGRSDSADTFRPLIEHLPKTHHYVTFDLPGCGYSDKLAPGNVLSVFNFVPALKIVADHYGEKPFVFVGHSMGAQIGILYQTLKQPSRITKFVDIDQLTAHQIEISDQGILIEGGATLTQWLEYYYINFYKPEIYKKLNGSIETAPSYTMEQCLTLVKRVRRLTDAAAETVLRRNLRPDPNNPGKYRLVWDQRMKVIARTPFSTEFMVGIRKRFNSPILLVMASETVQLHATNHTDKILSTLQRYSPYFRLAIIKGVHDLHLNTPELVAPHIAEFLEKDLESIEHKVISKI